MGHIYKFRKLGGVPLRYRIAPPIITTLRFIFELFPCTVGKDNFGVRDQYSRYDPGNPEFRADIAENDWNSRWNVFGSLSRRAQVYHKIWIKEGSSIAGYYVGGFRIWGNILCLTFWFWCHGTPGAGIWLIQDVGMWLVRALGLTS